MNERTEAVRQLSRARRAATEAAEWLERLEHDVASFEAPAAIDLVGSKEACEIVGMKPNTFAVARREGRTPPALAELAMGPVWFRETIEQWAAKRAADS